MELLSLDKKTCFVKSPAMHVYMKGNHRKAVNEFLLSKGFLVVHIDLRAFVVYCMVGVWFHRRVIHVHITYS